MMQRRAWSVFLALALFSSSCAFAQRNRGERPPAAAPTASPDQAAKPAPPAEPKKEAAEQPPVIAHHEVHAGGKTLRYTTTTGMMPLKNIETGEVEAHIF